MPRWNIELDTKTRLDLFKSKLEIALSRPSISQDEFMKLFLTHEEQILDVIVTEESVNNNTDPLEDEVPA